MCTAKPKWIEKGKQRSPAAKAGFPFKCLYNSGVEMDLINSLEYQKFLKRSIKSIWCLMLVDLKSCEGLVPIMKKIERANCPSDIPNSS